MGSERGAEWGGESAGKLGRRSNLGLVLEEKGLFFPLDLSLLRTRAFVLLS